MLVVPTFADVEHAQRELAERGAIFGARVMRFEWLFGEIAKRVGFDGRKASDFQRELIAEDAVRARPPGGAGGIGRAARLRARRRPFLCRAGTGSRRGECRRVSRARSAIGRPTGRARRYAEEIAAIYRAYREGLEDAGLVDAELFARGALGRPSPSPAMRTPWGRTPGLRLRLRRLQRARAGRARDAVAALRRRRHGLAARTSAAGRPSRRVSGVHQELLAMGADELELEPVDDHYADESRAALHHLERYLFEDEPGEPVEPGGAVVLPLRGRRARRGGARRPPGCSSCFAAASRPGDIAVVFRDPSGYSSLARAGLRRLRDPVLDRPHAAVRPHGSGPRPARPDPRVRRPAAPPRTCSPTCARPACCKVPGFADRLEAEVRREGAHAARGRARASGSATTGRSTSSTGSRGARDTAAFVGELESRLARAVRRPLPSARATVLSGPELDEARAFAPRRSAPSPSCAPCSATRPVDAAADACACWSSSRCTWARAPQPDRVQVATPEAIRARRFEAVSRLRPPGGRVPARRRARAVPVGRRPPRDRDRERAGAARARGPARPRALPLLRLRVARRAPARAELALERRGGQPAGRVLLPRGRARAARPATPSSARARSREVTWRPDDAPTAAEWDRAPRRRRAARDRSPRAEPLSSEPLLAELAARDAVPPRALEHFADCPVKWLVEGLLRPDELVPDPEAMVRG